MQDLVEGQDRTKLSREYDLNNDHTIDLTYENYRLREALRVLLVDHGNLKEEELPTDIEIIGDLARVKMTEKVYPHRFIVGRVI